jgi:uncharacterized protein YgbK (DUF1537 family)
MASYTLKFAIIADDLTGSLDTGLQFCKKGLATFVPLGLAHPWPKAQALVLNTDSRNIPGYLAYQRVYKACRNLKAKAIYKKIDSTMRGNVGMEVLAILNAQKIPKALIVPTVPDQGRTVERGILRVHGIPLLRTPYARDPFHPLWTSRIPDLLRKELNHPVGHIPLKEVRKDAAQLAQTIEGSPGPILVVDAALHSDLRSIASAWDLLSGRALACGSIALANELGPPPRMEKKKRGRLSQAPLLIISASRNPRTAEQIEEVRKFLSFPLLEPDLHRLANRRLAAREGKSITTRLREILSKSPGVILATTFQQHFPGKERAIPAILGKIAARLLRQTRLGGLVLTGGDLAMGVCRNLCTSALRIEEEVLPGIPCSKLVDGPFRGLRLVTKAGGFGEKDALWRITQYLRGEYES